MRQRPSINGTYRHVAENHEAASTGNAPTIPSRRRTVYQGQNPQDYNDQQAGVNNEPANVPNAETEDIEPRGVLDVEQAEREFIESRGHAEENQRQATHNRNRN